MKNLRNYTKQQLINILTEGRGYYSVVNFLGFDTLVSTSELSKLYTKKQILALVEKSNFTELKIMEQVDNSRLTDLLLNEGEVIINTWHNNQFPGASVIRYKEKLYATYYSGEYSCNSNPDEINRLQS